jgi:hypothetical protein
MGIVGNINEFKQFIANADRNSKFIYYIGDNCSESLLSREMAKLAYKSSIDRKTYLLQKRIKFGVLEYTAVKAGNPPPLYMIKHFPTSLRQFTEQDYRQAKLKQKEQKDGEITGISKAFSDWLK